MLMNPCNCSRWSLIVIIVTVALRSTSIRSGIARDHVEHRGQLPDIVGDGRHLLVERGEIGVGGADVAAQPVAATLQRVGQRPQRRGQLVRLDRLQERQRLIQYRSSSTALDERSCSMTAPARRPAPLPDQLDVALPEQGLREEAGADRRGYPADPRRVQREAQSGRGAVGAD